MDICYSSDNACTNIIVLGL